MNNCTYTTLYCSKDGYVVKCMHCKKIQLAFTNIILNMDLHEFQSFRLDTADKITGNNYSDFPDQKNITYYTDSENTMLVFSYNDLKVLYEMLQQANLMLEVNNILLNQN